MQETEKKVEKTEIEIYGAFKGVDISIIQSNSFIEQFGYKFVNIGLKELEENFSEVFLWPNTFTSNGMIELSQFGISINSEFYRALTTSNIFGHAANVTSSVIFIKKIKDIEVINFEKDEIECARNDLAKFIDSLIQQFRLFKNGDLDCVMYFEINMKTRKLIGKTRKIYTRYGQLPYILRAPEISILSKKFKEKFSPNDLTELALNNFNLSYEIIDIKTKFITLMTCLESLFNHSREQITHTISRHLALVISSSDAEFETNYNKIKKLYSIRSAVVHGGKLNMEDLNIKTSELQSMVRSAINYCMEQSLNKDQLFNKFNKMGYGRE